VARLLEAWWESVEPGVRFKASPASGGLKHAAEFDCAGDIITTSARFPWTVEVKCRHDWNPANLIHRGLSGRIAEYWREAAVEAAQAGRLPMLWARRKGEPWLVVMGDERGVVPGSLDLGDDLMAVSGTRLVACPATYWGERRCPIP